MFTKKDNKLLRKNKSILCLMQYENNAINRNNKKKVEPFDRCVVVNFQNNNKAWIYCYDTNISVIMKGISSRMREKAVDKLYVNKYFNGGPTPEVNTFIDINFGSIVSVSQFM